MYGDISVTLIDISVLSVRAKRLFIKKYVMPSDNGITLIDISILCVLTQ